jgi:hypothetical protein
MFFYKQVLEFYFPPTPTSGYEIFSTIDQIAAPYWSGFTSYIADNTHDDAIDELNWEGGGCMHCQQIQEGGAQK